MTKAKKAKKETGHLGLRPVPTDTGTATGDQGLTEETT
jgi:hypothetical protein